MTVHGLQYFSEYPPTKVQGSVLEFLAKSNICRQMF